MRPSIVLAAFFVYDKLRQSGLWIKLFVVHSTYDYSDGGRDDLNRSFLLFFTLICPWIFDFDLPIASIPVGIYDCERKGIANQGEYANDGHERLFILGKLVGLLHYH